VLSFGPPCAITQDSGKTNVSSGFEQMVYLPSVLTNVTTVNMWGGYVTLTGEHLGPPGTEFTLEFGLSDDDADSDFTTYSLNSSFWWTPRVTVSLNPTLTRTLPQP